MDRNLHHYVVAPGSEEWWQMNLGFLLFGVALFWISKKQSAESRQKQIAIFMALVLGLNVLVSHVYFASQGMWTLQNNLPLHLCAMSEILAVFMLLTRSQFIYELLIFWSAGAIHAFITPELTHGYGTYQVLAYCVSHGGVILVALYATWVMGLEPRKFSWFKVFLFTQLCLPVIGFINYLCGSNYMYLAQKPGANNPFVIGEWPWYIVGLELVVLVHFYLFYQIHRYLVLVKRKQAEAMAQRAES